MCGVFGIISKKEWDSWGVKKSKLRIFGNTSIPGINITSGSLGHCIGAGAGMAISYKKNNQDNKVYVVISEGELYEGSTWEALLLAKHRNLNNLTIIIDVNSLIILGMSLSFKSFRTITSMNSIYSTVIEAVSTNVE